MEVLLRIEGNRAILTGKPGPALLTLSKRLEGRKIWRKDGSFTFEVTPGNLERFKETYPGAQIEGADAAAAQFEKWAQEASPEARGAYRFKTALWPFQSVALARSAGFSPPEEAQGAAPAPAHPFPQGQSQTAVLHDPTRPNLAPAFAVLGEVGTGKTKILIDTAGLLWCAGRIDAVLVSAPKGVHNQWITEQLPEHLDSSSVPWQGAALNNDKKMPDWVPGVLHILAVNVDYARNTRGFDTCAAFIKAHRGRVLCIIDESHEIKTFTAKRTEAWTALGRMCQYRRIATGTPISKSLMDGFAQFYFLDRRIFGYEYMASFRSEYCIMGGADMREIVGNKNVEQFWEKIAPYSFRITQKEADLGLPPKHYVKHPFELSGDQKSHYLAMKQDMITRMDSGDLVEVRNVVSQLVRLQQITCGYLVKKGDKDLGIPDAIQYLDNARLDALKEIIDEREGKAVIWARFQEDIDAISRLLGSAAVTYDGRTSETQRAVAKRLFLDPHSQVQYLVANPAAGGQGLNLQGDCRTVIYYSNSFDALDRWQSEGRVHRPGARNAITYFDLLARGTIDSKILGNLRNKKSISDMALDDIRLILMAA